MEWGDVKSVRGEVVAELCQNEVSSPSLVVLCSVVLYSVVLYSVVLYSVVLYSVVLCSTHFGDKDTQRSNLWRRRGTDKSGPVL